MPALVDLAMFQMQRDSEQVGANCHAKSGGKDVDLQDFDCAKLNLQRALAIDDGYMPAFNQLALYYFGSAKKKAGSGKKFGRTIATNAAHRRSAATCSSSSSRRSCARRPCGRTPTTRRSTTRPGLILNELGQVNTAVKEFQAAAQLDPHFFEAQMNLAAINLSFRGFDKAEGAYRKALEMHPNDYDAHLGLALALRGQIDDSNYDKQVTAVQAELDACKKIDAARPDAYFNEGILTQEYKAKGAGGTDKAVAVYQQAKQIFQTLHGQGRRQDGVRRRGQEDQGADAGHRRHRHVPPGRRSAPAPPPPPAAAPGDGSASGSAAPAAAAAAGASCRVAAPRASANRDAREPWVLLRCLTQWCPLLHSETPAVTPNRVDPAAFATYTYTVIPADISSSVETERSHEADNRTSGCSAGSWPRAFVLLSAQSFAQDAAGAEPRRVAKRQGSGDYGYKFEDDPLSAGGFGPSDATIRVRPGPVRTTLIRPRTSFVPEMLKSVENI